MAERRMFAKSIIGSARFLRMPQSSRLLYYDLGMEADDDGCVEAFGVMRKTGAAEDDLRVLASKGFIKVLNEDFVSYISDWETNNKIRKDRYHEGVYKGLLDGFCPVALDAAADVATKWQPSDNQMTTEVRLGKDRVGKVSIERGALPAAEAPKRTRFAAPSVDEVRAYCQERGNEIDPQHFVDYYTSNGWMRGKTHIKDWKAAIRTWEQRDKKEKPKLPTADDYKGGIF